MLFVCDFLKQQLRYVSSRIDPPPVLDGELLEVRPEVRQQRLHDRQLDGLDLFPFRREMRLVFLLLLHRPDADATPHVRQLVIASFAVGGVCVCVLWECGTLRGHFGSCSRH